MAINLGDISRFKYLAHKVMPLVFDETLSYYEFLCKVIAKLNEVIDNENEQNTAIEQMSVNMDNWEEAAIQRYNEFTAAVDLAIEQFEQRVTESQESFEESIRDRADQFEDDITDQQDDFETEIRGAWDEFFQTYLQTLGVVQTTGTSTTDVMSQKAVTDEINTDHNILGFDISIFSVEANTAHSARNDRVELHIPQGTTYYVAIETDDPTSMSPQVYEFDANDTYTAQSTRAIPNGTQEYIAQTNVEKIGIYIASRTSAYNINLKVYTENSVLVNRYLIDTLSSEKRKNATAYVTANAISWYNSGNTCYLTIDNSIVIRSKTNSTNSLVTEISLADFLAIAESSSAVTVTDGIISGINFAIIYDFNSSTLKIVSAARSEVFDNALVLFAHFYTSWTGGELINNANNVETKTLRSELTEVESKVDILVPTLANYFVNEVNDCCNKLINDCEEKSLVIAFTTDNHYGNNIGTNFPTTVNTIKAVNDKFAFDFVIDGGDLIGGNDTRADALNRIISSIGMLNGIKGNAFTLVGNHDDDSYTASAEPLLTKEELYALYTRHSIIKTDYTNDTENYGYVDLDEFGIRLIFLDSVYGENGHDGSSWGFSDVELSWFSGTALDTTNQIIIFSHMPFTGAYTAYNHQVKNGVQMRTAVETFISNGGVCIGLFHGHNHWDFIGQYSDTNGFHEVSTGCGRVQEWDPDYLPEGASIPSRTDNTVTQELWDIIVVKPESRKVKMIRYGAGSDRSFTY